MISLAGPCISAATYIKRGYTRNCIMSIEASAKHTKKLPIYCVDTKGQKKVSITFDAAWGDEDAQQILDTLKTNNVRATFFMVGDWMRKYPDLVKRIAEDGHDVANHSNKHPHVNELSKEAVKTDLMGAHEEIKKITGKECFLYRPPYGEYNDTVLDAAKECNYYTIQWDVDSIDWKGYEADVIVKKVLEHKHLGNGSIILLHNGAKHTAQALPDIIKGLKEKGYEIVPISELIYTNNYTLDHEGRQHTT
ncbi:MAG: polysaccharide deacetylase family protein [Cellulosilyticum sp.]|nr:polysaccharide deacetylase family protein [Cellulosilyticum sp.]